MEKYSYIPNNLLAKKLKIDESMSPDMFEDSEEMCPSSQEKPKSNEKMTWRGSSLVNFTRLHPDNMNVPPIILAPDHEVYVKLPLQENKMPEPYPSYYKDVWNSKFVRMPNSPESLYPLKTTSGKSKVVQRWLVIEEAFTDEINSVRDLQKAIISYNHRYEQRWLFNGLKYLIEEEFLPEEKEYFFKNILPKIIRLALDLPNIVTRPIVLLTRKSTRSISLSQKQIACLLANAFLCTFPRRNAKGGQTEYANYPDINFNRLFLHVQQRVLEKLRCLIHYFKEVTSRIDLNGMVTFTRQHIGATEMPDFESCTEPLSRFHVDSKGLIEEVTGLLQVDFANKYVGGGVLGLGCVQEEIRFMLCPELLVSRLFTEVLDKDEALIVTGVEQFSKCRGYASNFEWSGPHLDLTPRDSFCRKLCQVVALDALHFHSKPSQQYKPHLILRELQKAYVGFRPLEGSRGSLVGVATGNWGCGAFKGDPRLKGLIQIAAASAVGRDVAYFTFGDQKLRDELADVHQVLKDKAVTVGQLVLTLCQYGKNGEVNGRNFLKYVYRSLSDYYSDTESDSSEHGNSQKPSSSKGKTNERDEKTIKKITDYFKPKPKLDNGLPVTNQQRPRKERSEGQQSLAEAKIMEALSECDKLFKGSGKETVPGEGKSLKREREECSSSGPGNSAPSCPSKPSLFDRLDELERGTK